MSKYNDPNFSTSPSQYFHNYEWAPRQKMVEDLIISALRQKGINMKYIPRENFVRDELFGDDIFTKFERAVTLEGYIKNVDMFEGAGDLFSRMGITISDEVTITISKKRWFAIQQDIFIPEDGESIKEMPRSGDLLWLPGEINKMFEITHVERESVFYQFGKNYVFDLKCELYKFNQDEFSTGFDSVDSVSEDFGRDTANKNVIFEDGGNILFEDGGEIVQDDYKVEDTDVNADNQLLQMDADDLINRDERGPFVKGRKW